MRRDDEQRIVARFEHAHHPIYRCVRIDSAHRFDERADDVVMLVAGFVVEQRRVGMWTPLRASRAIDASRPRFVRIVLGDHLERRQRASRVASCALWRLRESTSSSAASFIAPSPRCSSASARRRTATSLPSRADRGGNFATREQRGVHGELRIFRGRADERRSSRLRHAAEMRLAAPC